MTASKIFLYFCLAFTLGVFLNSFFHFSQLLVMDFLILGFIFIAVFWRYKKIAVFGFCVLFLALGIWRHQIAELKIVDNELQKLNDGEGKITLVGMVDEEPSISTKSIKLKIKTLQGSFLVTTSNYPQYQYGDVLEITGKLKTPAEDLQGFNYREYLSKEGIYSEMSWPAIKSTGENQGNFIYKQLFGLKSKLKESISRLMSPPQSGLLEALLFGDEENISQEWKDKFNLTGTRHITAVSGMNITIIAALFMNFFIALGLWKKQAFYISVILLVLYILMIGAPQSGVRAAIMGILFLSASQFGRLSSAYRAVIFASTFMLFLNPLVLKLDIGFQLSFLAVMGLIFLQSWFLGILGKIPNVFQVRNSLAATLSAQVFTLPILIYNFGQISATGFLTNILIVPALPLLTIFGFILAIFGMVLYPLGILLSWPAWFLLSYLLKTIDFFSKFSFALIKIENFHWLWLTLFYLILFVFVWRLRERERLKNLEY
jgi:competence protein ComEC